MNRIFRLVWNDATQSWNAVAETARSHGKGASRPSLLVCAAAGLIVSAPALGEPAPNALPAGGQVVGGQAGVSQSGAAMTITQGSERAAIDWATYNIGRDASVHYQQPAGGVALNRVNDANPSQIFGRLTATGQVFLSNPNGVYFAPGASVDVGGLVATTHTISVEDFMAGKTRFERKGTTGTIINEGELKAALGGYIALLAPEVRNQGVIVANLGTVALAAGESFELQFEANNTLAGLRVTASTIEALVENKSAVLAPGGLIILSAQAADRVQAGVIKNSGRLEATGLSQRGGRIVLEASGRIENSGSITANAGGLPKDAEAGGPAGEIRLSAPEVINSGTIAAAGNAARSADGKVEVSGGAEPPQSDDASTSAAAPAPKSAPAGGRIEIAAHTLRQSAAGVLDVSGAAQGGELELHISQRLELAGRLDASAHADLAGARLARGGAITIAAPTIDIGDAHIDVSGGIGGSIMLDARPVAPTAPPPLPAPPTDEPGKLALTGSTQISARGRRGSGGEITLLGDDISLSDVSSLVATGATGGGTVRVGGDWQGGGALYQATTVHMAAGARIDVSATANGDGGTAVLWSDVTRAESMTAAHGTLLARGGTLGGDGGRIETSGFAIDTTGIVVNAGADYGAGGLWLIDPADATITQPIADAYAATLSTGTSVLNDVAGTITWNSGVTLSKTSGGDATLTLRTGSGPVNGRDIVLNGASISASAGALNLVLWTRFNSLGYSGKATITGSTLNTNGGHVWIGGGNATTWNGLAVGDDSTATWAGNEQGIRVANSSVSTGVGNIAMFGMSYQTGANNGQSNYGVHLENGTSLTTTSGNITLNGTLRGQYTNGAGIVIGSNVHAPLAGNVSIATADGDISVVGTGQDQAGSASGWRHAVLLTTARAGDTLSLRTQSGNIHLDGTASFGAGGDFTSDTSGIQFQAGATTAPIQVLSQSGNITLTGRNTQEAGTNENAIRFTAADASNVIRIGDDGSGTYTGNILIQGNSLLQRNANAGAGSISVKTTGGLTIESVGNSFTQLRADAGTLSFDNDWNFGSTLGSFTLGKSTNTLGLTLSNALSVAGPISLYGGQVVLTGSLTSSATGDIFIQSVSTANPSIHVLADILKTGGARSTLTLKGAGRVTVAGSKIEATNPGGLNVVLWSDFDGGDQGGVSLQTNITTAAGHVWAGGSGPGAGSSTWNGLVVGDGPSVGANGFNHNAFDLAGNIDTSGGDVLLWAGTGYLLGINGLGLLGSSAINAGSGDIILLNNTVGALPLATLKLTTDGQLIMAPNGGGFDSAFTWNGTLDLGLGILTGLGSLLNMVINGVANLSGLTIGQYDGMAGISVTNSSDVTISKATRVAGPIELHGGNITLNDNLTATAAGAGILVKASGNITTRTNRTLQTNGGAITLWSDSDNSGQGYILVSEDGTLDSRTQADRTATTHTTGGGAITLGGGADNGSGAPAGYATATSGSYGGVNLGDYLIGGHTNDSRIFSGGGDVLIRGRSTYSMMGINWVDGGTVNAGSTGLVRFDGVNTSTGHGLEIGTSNNGGIASVLSGGGSAGTAAIMLSGSAISTTGWQGIQTPNLFAQATGSGGIIVTGSAGGGGSSRGVLAIMDLLSASGDIKVNGGVAGVEVRGGTLGRKAATAVTASSANVSVTGDAVLYATSVSNIATTGTVTVQPHSASFSSALTWPLANLSLSADITGLTLGKPGNTADITVTSAQTIAGPIDVHGGTIVVNPGAALNAASGGANGSVRITGSGNVTVNAAISAGSDISIISGNDVELGGALDKSGAANGSLLVKADRHVLLNSAAQVTATGGGRLDTQLWADVDASGDGIVIVSSAGIATGGGSFRSGNGATATIGGSLVTVGGDIYFNGTVAQTIDTAGGAITIEGETTLANAAVAGVTFDSGGGDIAFNGLINSGNAYSYVDGPDGLANSWSWARTDAKGGGAGGAAQGDSYLVNITSRLENSIAGIASGYRGAWIGAYRANPAGSYNWQWADGPEAGRVFFTQVAGGGGASVPGGYANFGSSEPNGTLSAGGESVGQFFGTAGAWNDLGANTAFAASQASQYSVLGYVRETNLAPTALTIDAGAGVVTVQGGVGNTKALSTLTVRSGGVTVNGNALVTAGAQDYNSALTVISPIALNVASSGLRADGAIQLEGSTLTLNGNLTAANASAVVLRADALSLPQAVAVDTAGELTIEPQGSSFTSALTYPLNNLSPAGTVSALTIGKTGNTAAITVGAPVTVSGDIRIHSGALALSGALSAGDTITLDALAGVTQTAALSANMLLLTGAGSAYALTHTGNQIGTLAAANIGSLTYIDSNALEVGTVGATLGVSASGPLSISTQNGDLSVSQTIVTTDMSASAIVLNAGRSAAAGTASGGDVMLNGNPAIDSGAGGRATIYSGSVAGSTGVTAWAGAGSGRFRYNSDESTSNFTAALGAGRNAIFRELPTATVAVGSQTITYGDAMSTVSGTASGLLNGDAPVYAVSSPVLSTSGNIAVSGSPYTLVTTNLATLGYNLTSNTSGTLTVSAKPLTLSGFSVDGKVYDGTTAAAITGAGSLAGVVGADVVGLSHSGASFDSRNVGTGKTVTLNGVSLTGADGANYSIASTTDTADISVLPITLTVDPKTKTYGDADPALTFANSVALAGGDSFVGTLTRSPGETVAGGPYAISQSSLGIDDGNGGNNYAVSFNGNALAITPRPITLVANVVSKTYGDADPALVVSIGGGSLGSATVSDSLADVTGTLDREAGENVGSYDITLGSGIAAGNYAITFTVDNNALSIVAKALALAGSIGVSKTYDGNTNMPAGVPGYGSLSGIVGSDDVSVVGQPVFDSPNAGGRSINVGSVGLGGTRAGNYTLTWTNGSGTIDPAALTVRADNDAKFVTQADSAGYAGVSYSGFVNGETTAVLGGAVSISRSNAGTESAGVYRGVLTPSGLTSANYAITYVGGDYTIVPANALLIRVTDVSNTYGTATSYVLASAEYWNGAAAVNLAGITHNGGNNFTVADGAGGSATFTLAPQGAVISGAGKLAVGSYQLGTTGTVTENSANFNDTLTVAGSHSVAQKAVTVSVGGVSKVYDGTAAMTGIRLSASGIETGDQAVFSGSGAFATRNVGAGLDYTVTGLALNGSDAGNYLLNGASSLSGSDGEITARALDVTYTGVDKVYDGNTGTSVILNDNRVAGDDLTLGASAVFGDKNAGIGKAVNVSGVSLGGTDAGNYALASNSGVTTANIARLDSVTWTGGAGGNWFDPANWAGGAVPDLSNVANVVIPDGTVVDLGSDVVAPAQNGPVNIDSLSGGGLEQSDGALHSNGDITLDSFAQSGGSTGTDGNFTVRRDYSQDASGMVMVAGATRITDTRGGVTIGNLTTGTLDVTSTDGGVSQPAGTTIRVSGSAVATSDNGGVVLDGDGNFFGGGLNVFDASTRSRTVVSPPPVVPAPLPVPANSPPPLVSADGAAPVGGTATAARADTAGDNAGVVLDVVRESSSADGGLITVSVPKRTDRSASGFTFRLPARLIEAAADSTVLVSLPDGSPLPPWLHFDAEENRFTATEVPEGGLPIEVAVTIGERRTIIMISERRE